MSQPSWDHFLSGLKQSLATSSNPSSDATGQEPQLSTQVPTGEANGYSPVAEDEEPRYRAEPMKMDHQKVPMVDDRNAVELE